MNNSTSCFLMISFSILKINIELGKNEIYVEKEVFFIWGLKVGEMVPFPVLKINFGLLGNIEDEQVSEGLRIRDDKLASWLKKDGLRVAGWLGGWVVSSE